MSQLQHYVYQIRAARPGFDQGLTPEESRVMSVHFEYLARLLTEGKLVMAGPCLDYAFGLAILETESEDEAHRLMEADPAVAGGVMLAEFHPFKLSLVRSR